MDPRSVSGSAFGPYPASVRFNGVPCDRKAEARAAAGSGFIRFVKTLEDTGKIGGVDADTGVGNRNDDALIPDGRRNSYMPARGREFD